MRVCNRCDRMTEGSRVCATCVAVLASENARLKARLERVREKAEVCRRAYAFSDDFSEPRLVKELLDAALDKKDGD